MSSGAFGGGTLFMAGNTGVIDGVGYPGTVNALNPATGAFAWQHAAPGSVIGALAYDNGMVFDGGGSYLEVLSATTGERLYSYDTGSQIYGAMTSPMASSTSGTPTVKYWPSPSRRPRPRRRPRTPRARAVSLARTSGRPRLQGLKSSQAATGQ